MPVKAAGWRIEPPVSVPVAPRHRSAATAEAMPQLYASGQIDFGRSIQAGALIGDKKKNETVYGEKMEAILFSGRAQPTPAGLQLIESLNAFAGQAAVN